MDRCARYYFKAPNASSLRPLTFKSNSRWRSVIIRGVDAAGTRLATPLPLAAAAGAGSLDRQRGCSYEIVFSTADPITQTTLDDNNLQAFAQPELPDGGIIFSGSDEDPPPPPPPPKVLFDLRDVHALT